MFKVTFITPTSQKVVSVVWLECQTPTGNLVIQKGHAPLVSLIQPYSEVIFQSDKGEKESLEISGGVLEVQRESALIIID